MGNLLRFLHKNPDECDVDMIIDFEDSTPGEEEKEIYDLMEGLLGQLDVLNNKVKEWPEYPPSQNERSLPDDAELTPYELCQVEKSTFFLLFSEVIDNTEQVMSKLLAKLFLTTPDAHVLTGFSIYQALAKQFVKILNSALLFDTTKMCTCQVVNDLSSLKRSLHLPRMKKNIKLTSTVANQISLILADPISLLSQIINLVKKMAKQESISEKDASFTLAQLANLCKQMTTQSAIYSNFKNPDTRVFILRVMVCAILLSDHIDPAGLFNSTEFDTLGCLKAILLFPEVSKNYLSILRYQSKNGNSSNLRTPIKSFFKQHLDTP